MDKYCYVCGTNQGVHLHHVFGGSNRKISEKHNFKVCLCGRHHNLSDEGVHFNKKLDLKLKREFQAKYEETHTRQEFIALIGRNYLED